MGEDISKKKISDDLTDQEKATLDLVMQALGSGTYEEPTAEEKVEFTKKFGPDFLKRVQEEAERRLAGGDDKQSRSAAR